MLHAFTDLIPRCTIESLCAAGRFRLRNYNHHFPLPPRGRLTTFGRFSSLVVFFCRLFHALPYYPFFFFGDAGRPSATATAWNRPGGMAATPGRILYRVCAYFLETTIPTGSCPLPPPPPFLPPITFLLQIILSLSIGHSSLLPKNDTLSLLPRNSVRGSQTPC